ncbi:transporter [Ganoderma sinense ZZ0214-1]|uniref:Transporter n=1 Tax=Ganoderma sinense ZZ0214-1 TaxID=1077348 RepID=A0A2G8RQW0_9APHY|nr:transporter [Ganoderma sinense ZZ0214-1]
MDGPLKELSKLEKLASGAPAGKGKSPSIDQSLDALLDSLRVAKERFLNGTGTRTTLEALAKAVEDKKKEIDERQKEVYNALARVGKALDKKFTNPLPSYEPLFASPEAKLALERTVAMHFLRTGQFETAETFLSESDVTISQAHREQFMDLHGIMTSLRQGDITPALEWTHRHREFLRNRSSSLEFHLHRFQYLRLALSYPPNCDAALVYARVNLSPFYIQHRAEVQRLMTCVLYLPMSKLLKSPYADLADPSVHFDLQSMFATEYCASLGMSRQAPLRVIGDIGGGGALARIEKGRKVMRERKSEWSQTDELPCPRNSQLKPIPQ